MAKKKTKNDAKKAALQARKDAKADKAARKRLAKQKSKEGGDHDENEPDEEGMALDDLLEIYRKKDAEVNQTVMETLDSFPQPRANASWTVTEDKNGHIYLFGGEYYDGVGNIVLDDLLRWDPTKSIEDGSWKRIITPSPRPPARCAHSCVNYKHYLYVFGGELANADEYHHYKDIWRFDTKQNKWEEVKFRNVGTPCTARSGHCAFVWKNFMVLFGGFYEALRDTRWFNDVCVFDLQSHTWLDIPYSKLATRPEARSACNIGVYADMAIIHGGYSKLKNPTTKGEAKVHNDAWILHLKPLLQGQPPTWERLSVKNAREGGPKNRSGTASVTYKNQRMIVFGGVEDEEQYHHKVDSVFYNQLIAFDMERRKWFPLKCKGTATEGKSRRRRKEKVVESKEEEENEEVKEEEEEEEDDSADLPENGNSGWDISMLRSNMFAFIDGDGNLVYEKIEEDEVPKPKGGDGKIEGKIDDDEEEEEKEEEKEEEEKEEDEEREVSIEILSPQQPSSKLVAKSEVMTMNEETGIPEAVLRAEPLPRINAGLVIRSNVLYLYGGLLEVGDREVTLDDCWCLDLRKRERWECLWEGTMHKQVWKGAVHDDDDSYISTGAEEDSDADYSDDERNEELDEEVKEASRLAKKAAKKAKKKAGIRQEILDLKSQLGVDDDNRTPLAGEAMADFYSRTSAYWTIEAAQIERQGSEPLSQKELKREGFSLAQERYEELRPVLERLAELDLQQQHAEEGKSKEPRDGKKKSKKNKKSSK